MTVVSFNRRSRRSMGALLMMLPLALAACTPAAPGDASAPEAPVQQAATAAPADPAVYRGATVAQQVCAQCHDIGTGVGPAIYAGAPTFASVLDKPDTTSEGLAKWLKSSHPSMPHYVFNDAEVGDLVAYIMSLRKPQ